MKRLGYILLLLSLLSSCGKEAAPQAVYLIPQIVSTEVIPSHDAVELYASVSGPSHFTDCGFGIIRNELIREYIVPLDSESMSFTLRADGLDTDSEYSFYAFLSNGTARIQTPARTFRTLETDPGISTEPSVGFLSVQAVPSDTAALLTAELSETEDVSEVGFALARRDDSFIRYSATRNGKGFSLTLDSLEEDTDYRYYAWAVQRGSVVSSEPQHFHTQKTVHSASFTALSAESDAFSVRIFASVSDGDFVEACGFGLSRAGRNAIEYGAALSGNDFCVAVQDLLPDTDYYWYAFFLIDGERTNSAFQHFRTAADPRLHLLDIKAQADIYTAFLEARLSRVEGVSACGFAISGEGGSFERRECPFQEDGTFSLSLDSLAPETDYAFYVWAQEEDGSEVLSDILSFTTRQAPHEAIVFTELVAEPGTTSVRLSARLSGKADITDCGFGISTNRYDFVEYTATLDGDGFFLDLGELKAGTPYYFYAYFVLDGKMYLSQQLSFNTLP